MAEFKLGRLRFVWKNEWTTGTIYYKDDVVAFNGKIYICVIGHTSQADFYADLNVIPSKWNIVSDGQTWLGDWQPNTEYRLDNIVKYGGRVYICKTPHISAEDSGTGLEADLDKWEVFAEGLDWKGNWTTSFDYKVNDLVKYGGSTYVCNEAHISAATIDAGLEEDQSKWDPFNQGFDSKGSWQSGFRYRLNDVVKFGASLWIATQGHTSQGLFNDDADKWDKFVEGFQYESEWSPSKGYQPGDIALYGGNQYIALTDNINSPPSTSETDWSLFSNGLRFRGEWNEDSSNVDYNPGDVVSLGGYNYRCIKDNTDAQPPNEEFWQLFSTGIAFRGLWLDDQEYFEGDVVRFQNNTWICVQNHISEGDDFSTVTRDQPGGGNLNSRPDLDDGTYWNIFTVGLEESVLIQEGDLVYFEDNGPRRLPIGQNGQILQVSPEGLPEWAFIGQSVDVYYVAEFGENEPAPIYGKSIDRPWRSIRYACQQIERGTKAPAATELLELNRRFIQREIVEWTQYQIANNIAPFTSSFNYDTKKCERDMGLIIDAFIWDLGHGGNVRSREAALSYVNDPGKFYAKGQEAETVASINYGISLIQKVLAQEPPDELYQVLNGDNSTRIAEQIFILDLGSLDIVEYEGITAGSSTGGIFSGSSEGSSGFTGSGIGGY